MVRPSADGSLLFRLGRGHKADKFHEAGQDSKNESDEIEPAGMQPAVEACADEPSYDGRGREDERELAVVGELQDEASLLPLWGVFGHAASVADSRWA